MFWSISEFVLERLEGRLQASGALIIRKLEKKRMVIYKVILKLIRFRNFSNYSEFSYVIS